MKKLLSALFGVALLATSPARAAQVCGNGIVEAPETCDDGNTVNGDACPNTCGTQPPTLAVADATATEVDSGPSFMVFPIERAGSPANAINVGYRTVQGTAFTGPDFTELAGRLVIGETVVTTNIPVPLHADDIAELDEQFSLEIANAYEAGGITMIHTDPALAAGTSPWSLLARDFNADGKPDLVAGSLTAANFSVLRNTGTPGAPGFAAATTEVTGSNDVFALASADFDGDGNPDIVLANRSAGTLRVHRHVSAPGTADFESPLDLAAGAGTTGVAAGDLNRDGKPDIVACNQSGHSVTYNLNTSADGVLSFGSTQTLPACTGPTGVKVADLDGDGDDDIVVACYAANQLQLFLNNLETVAADFGSPATHATRPGVWDVQVADIDADGKLDVVTADVGSNTVSVFRNTSIGPGSPLTVEAPVWFPTGGAPNFMAAGDVDGDGLADLAVANRLDNTVSVYRNTTQGSPITFADRVTYAVGAAPRWVGIADFDGDAQADIAVANNESNTISVVRNNRPVVAITQASATGTIADDDEVKIAFATDTGAVDETTGTFTVTVTALGVSDEAISVSYALSGTATSGTDYTISPSTVTFAPGDASKTLTISGLADASTDGSATETIVITLQDPANAGLNPPNPFTLTVTNDSNTPIVVTPPPSPTPTPTAPASSGGGGALNFGLLVLLGLGALARRRVGTRA